MSQNPIHPGAETRPRTLHQGSTQYVIVPRGSSTAGEHVPIADRQTARAFVAALASDPSNLEVLRAVTKDLAGVPSGGVPSGFGGRPDEGEWAPLTEALASGSVEAVRLITHVVLPCQVTTSGVLTLSEVSWGETEGLYPSASNLYKPNKWDGPMLCELLKARSALNDVATRNPKVRKAMPGSSKIEVMLRPYHCIENFPRPDPEIDERVKWFYLSSSASTPAVHPGTNGTALVKSYGPFYNTGGGDVKQGACYLLFYRLAGG